MNINKNIIVNLLFTILICGAAFPRTSDLKFERIGREKGLTASSVLSILQDRQGFMWFGTTDGLFRYDGYNMTVYKHDRLDSTSLGNNNVFALVEDRKGTLWIGTAGGGLNRFDRETEQFVRYKHDPEDPNSLSADVVSALYEDSSGDLWIGTWNGLSQLDAESGKIIRFVHDPVDPNSMNPRWIRTIFEDSTGAIWVGTEGGISRFDRRTKIFTHFTEDRNNPNSLSSNAVSAILKDHSGTVWIGSWGGLDRFDQQTQHFTNLFKESKVTSICEDHSGNLWIGTNKCLLLFDHATEQFTRFVYNPTNKYSLSSNEIQTIYEDNNEVVWIGTQNGVNRLDRRQFRFKQIVHDPDDSSSLSHRLVTAIHESRDGALWIATAKSTASGIEAGLGKLDRNTEWVEHPIANLRKDVFQRFIGINHIYQDHLGVLWLGTWAGLIRYDPLTEQFTIYEHDPKDSHSLSGNFVWRIHEDQTGTIWVAVLKDGPSGIDRFDRTLEQFSHIDFIPELPMGSNQKNGVHSISEGKSGRIWFATMGDGIFLLNPESQEFVQFTHEPDNPNSLSHGWIGVVHEDRTGMVWSAPWYGGLNKFDPESEKVIVYTEKDGLASNYITSIVEDDIGHLWLTTKNGLSRFDPRNETFKNFDTADGLLHTGFEIWNVSIKSRTGEVFFGGENGIDYVHPDNIRDNPYIPPVVFTRFARYNSRDPNGKIIIEKGISEKKRFDLTFQDHTLTFEFAALNFRNPLKNQYAYKLEGFSDNWISLGAKHDITFTNLDPGEYTLHVKGSNNDNVWNEEGASLVINISPPWWKTGWAHAFSVILLGLILYSVRRFELKRTYLKNELEKRSFESRKLKEIDELKSRFFANISHEFRTPLTLILGPLQTLLSKSEYKERREDIFVMQKNAQRLHQLIDQLLDLSKLEAGRMPLQAQPDDIVQRIREWAASFVSLAESRNISFDLNIPNHSIIVYFDVEKLEKIIYNLLGNAFKFTPEGGRISIAVSCLTDQDQSAPIAVKITISDSGVGISSEHIDHVFDRFYSANGSASGEQGSTGIGLALAKEFVDLHHGKIFVESEPGEGSTFKISLPLGRDHLSDEEIIDHVYDAEVSELSHRPEQITAKTSQEIPEDISAGKNSHSLVLIVDDNHDMRHFLHSCLDQDFGIIEAENGESGYQTALRKIPDLIVSDVMMPQMDGLEFCRKIKTDERTSHIPIILLTARASKESKVEGLENGADDYIVKPFDAEELMIRAKNLIKQRQQMRERFSREITVQPKDITVNSVDEQFLQRALSIVEENISNSDFKIDQFSTQIGMSRPTLNRKLRAVTGLSTNEFIRTLRLKRALQLLENRSATINEIAYEVGFNNPSYFAECFREQFGEPPSKYTSH